MSVPPLVRRTHSVSAEVAAHLERLIVSGELRPGDRLPPERELAATMGVSRPSLREAMFELESKKLVERHQGRGSIVAEPARGTAQLYDSLSDLDVQIGNASEVRDLVEPGIAELAALRAVESNLVALESVLTRSGADLTPEASIQLDVEFHSLLAHAAQNPLLVALCSMTMTWTEPTRALSHRTALGRRISVDGHRAIFAAVLSQDGPGAAAAMTRHLQDVRELSALAAPHHP
ncbi:FadR/GntR family transcriptional regulator [Rhodococcus sp. X156]|uniref:FadR/GntR family transcriptional regulator n=1 Tax=Rhodococcus sp. X156 TaxID=2499145 RepID=UPI001F498333|nr:FadR/GntR family transcriptional regulator [Rhodococcus sp. X156]